MYSLRVTRPRVTHAGFGLHEPALLVEKSTINHSTPLAEVTEILGWEILEAAISAEFEVLSE